MALTLGSLAAATGLTAEGALEEPITGIAEPSAAGPGDIAVAMSPSYAEKLAAGRARLAVLWPGADWQALGLSGALFAPRPRPALAGLTAAFAPTFGIEAGAIHPSAIIDPSADCAPDLGLGPFSLIGPGAAIGPDCRIASHVSIGAGSRIGPGARIHAGVRIAAGVTIGAGFIAQAGAVIGGDGFSFAAPEPGALDEARATGSITRVSTAAYARIHSLGGVTIGDDVEIGANAAIDRGTLADTTIGDGTKIDNLVQIGHNVTVGRTCLLCGQAGIAGSATIGDRVVVGGQSAVADHTTIGADVIIAGKTGIASNVPPRRVMMGNPAFQMDQNIAAHKAYRRLPRLVAKVEALQKQVSKLISSE